MHESVGGIRCLAGGKQGASPQHKQGDVLSGDMICSIQFRFLIANDELSGDVFSLGS